MIEIDFPTEGVWSEIPYQSLLRLHEEVKKKHLSRNEFLKAQLEPGNEYNIFIVAFRKRGAVVGYLSKRKTSLFFLHASDRNCCLVDVTRKGVNHGNGEGLQIPCVLHVTGEAKYINKLKGILSSLTYK